MRNSQRSAAFLWFGLSILGILSAAVWSRSIIAFDLRGAVIFLGAFLFIGAGVVGVMFWRRALIWDEMYKGEDVVASFSYPQHLLQKLAERVKEERMEINTMRFVFISVIVAIVAVLAFILLIVDKSYEVLGPLVLVFVMLEILMYIAAKLSPARAYQRVIKSDGLVIISSKGVLFCNEFHIWKSMMSRLEGVHLEKRKKTGQTLCFRYSYYVSVFPPLKNFFDVSIPFFEMDSRDIAPKVMAHFNYL